MTRVTHAVLVASLLTVPLLVERAYAHHGAGLGERHGEREIVPRLRMAHHHALRPRHLEEAMIHREARAVVESGGLTPGLMAFVQDRWEDQFGLIEVG